MIFIHTVKSPDYLSRLDLISLSVYNNNRLVSWRKNKKIIKVFSTIATSPLPRGENTASGVIIFLSISFSGSQTPVYPANLNRIPAIRFFHRFPDEISILFFLFFANCRCVSDIIIPLQYSHVVVAKTKFAPLLIS